YGLVHRLATRPPQIRGGFIHVPWPAGQPTPAGQVAGLVDLETAIEAIRIALQVTLIFGAGDLRRGAGAID
ncbi:MAG: pyroglutamyl-peptidase I, partial [Lautropia sp.]